MELVKKAQVDEKRLYTDNRLDAEAREEDRGSSSSVPPPPLLLCRTDTTMVFKPAPFSPTGEKVNTLTAPQQTHFEIQSMYVHTYIHTCMHTYLHACMHAYIHACIYIYIYIYIYHLTSAVIDMRYTNKYSKYWEFSIHRKLQQK